MCTLVIAALGAAVGCGRLGFDDRMGQQGDDVGGTDAGGSGTGDGSAVGRVPTNANYVFVTSTATELGALGSLANADRLGTARGWVRPDGRPVADTVDDLISGAMFYLPRLDEYGATVTYADVVTGTNMNGAAAPQTCADWTSTTGYAQAGRPDAGMPGWTSDFVAFPCADSLPLYCFGVDRAEPVRPAVMTGRRAFVTSGQWTPGGGLASADAFCQGEADAAPGTAGGTYLALLGTDTASPISRFDTSLSPWQRVDGVFLVEHALDLVSSHLAAPFDVTATGTPAIAFVMTSGVAPAQIGSQNCRNWQSSSRADTWRQGASTILGPEFYDDMLGVGGAYCSGGGRLYCLER
jgi:hypothetical protein